MSEQTNSIKSLEFCKIAVSNIDSLNSLESTGDNGRQPPLLPPRLRATIVDTRIHSYRLSAAP